MSEPQRKEAKRIFELLLAMGWIKEVQHQYPYQKYLEMSLRTEAEWINALSEAIAMYKSEELEEDFKKAGLKK